MISLRNKNEDGLETSRKAGQVTAGGVIVILGNGSSFYLSMDFMDVLLIFLSIYFSPPGTTVPSVVQYTNLTS